MSFNLLNTACKSMFLGDGLVDISEFLTQWGSLKSEGTDDLNETIDITG